MTGPTCKVTACVPTQPKLSVTRNVIDVPTPFVVVGVPVMAPVLVLKPRPAGRVPLVMEKV